MVVTVLLAEDMHMVRGALVALLETEPDIEVIAEVTAGDEVVPKALEHRPDVVVVDVELPRLDGLSAAMQLQHQVPEARVLVLTALGKPGTLRRALAAKVDGFLLKDAPADRLAAAIRGVAVGQRVIDGHLALAALDAPECPLTDRELEVLRLTSQGAEPGEIAASVHLSVGTVRNYLTTLTAKLNARNRVDAIRIAWDAGWL